LQIPLLFEHFTLTGRKTWVVQTITNEVNLIPKTGSLLLPPLFLWGASSWFVGWFVI